MNTSNYIMTFMSETHELMPAKVVYGNGEISSAILAARNDIESLKAAGFIRHFTTKESSPLGFTDWIIKEDEHGLYFVREPAGTEEARAESIRKANKERILAKAQEDLNIEINALSVDTARVVHLQDTAQLDNKDLNTLNSLKTKLAQVHQVFKSYEKLAQSLEAYLGEWNAEEIYAPGDVVEHRGAVYIAEADVSNYPPDDVPGGWRKLGVNNGA